MFCQIFQSWRFRLVCLQKLIFLFRPAKGFKQFRVVECFCVVSKAATSALIVGHSGNDLEFFID